MTQINITSAEQVGEHCICLTFDDGKKQVVDFKPFLSKSLHPGIRDYLDPALFSTFRIEYGDLVWGDYDLCFPIIDLYQNKLEKNEALEAVA